MASSNLGSLLSVKMQETSAGSLTLVIDCALITVFSWKLVGLSMAPGCYRESRKLFRAALLPRRSRKLGSDWRFSFSTNNGVRTGVIGENADSVGGLLYSDGVPRAALIFLIFLPSALWLNFCSLLFAVSGLGVCTQQWRRLINPRIRRRPGPVPSKICLQGRWEGLLKSCLVS